MDKYIATGNEKILTRVVIEQYDKRYIVESPYSDDNTIEMLLECVNACAVASSWSKEAVLSVMQDYIDEHSDNNNIN